MRTITVVLGCCVGLAAAAFSGCGNGDTVLTKRTFRLTEDPKTQETLVIDVPPKTQTRNEFTPGDTIVVTKKLYDGSHRFAGNTQLICTITFGGKDPTAACGGTLELRDGKLSVNVTFTFSEEPHIGAVTGGTRAYAGATGTITAGIGGGNVDEFNLLLPSTRT